MAAEWFCWMTAAECPTSGFCLLTRIQPGSSPTYAKRKFTVLPGPPTANTSFSLAALWSKTSCSSQPPVSNRRGDSSSNSRMQGLDPSAVLGLRFCSEVAAFPLSDEHHPMRIGLLEVLDDRLVGHICIIPSLADVLHVPSAFSIELMKERIVPPIEFQWMHSEPLAQT